jgi:uncharacterized repeat protein (TIGR01451 family)
VKIFKRNARAASGLSFRRPAAVCAICALGSVLTLAGSALAVVGDGILGRSTAYSASTVCPSGEAVTGVLGDTDGAGAVLAVRARCSGGTDAGEAIGADSFGDTGGTACGMGEVGVGIVGVEESDAESSPLLQLSLRCRASDLGGATSTAVPALGSAAGVADGPYDCPDGQVLAGLTGWVSQFDDLQGIEIQCDSPSSSLPTIVISGSAPDGVVGVPYDFSYTASGDSGITFSVLGSLPPGLTFDPTLQTLGGTPTTAGVYAFVVRATGASGASTDLDESVTIAAPPPAVGLSPTGVAFGDQPVGATSTTRTVTITNTAASGAKSLTLGQLALGGSNSGDFSLSNDTCSNASVAAGSSCTVDVSFAPTAVGLRGASLSIPSNAGSSPDAVALTGTGTPPGADLKLGISGPTTAASGSQDTYVVTVSNLGPATATGVVMTVQVPNGTKFVGVSTTQGSCSHPASGATSGTISCSLGSLTSGATAADSVTLKLSLGGKGGTIALVASASASTPDPDLSNNVASLATTVKKK